MQLLPKYHAFTTLPQERAGLLPRDTLPLLFRLMDRLKPRRFIIARASSTGLAFAVCVANLCLSGCYAYTPVQTAAVNPDDQVRVIVSRETASRLARDFGTVAPELEGQLRPMGRDSLAFNIWVGKGFSGTDFAGAQQTLPLARSDIREVYRRQFSAKRTTLFALGVVAAGAILVNRLAPGERNPGDDPIEPPPPPVDLIRVRWHF